MTLQALTDLRSHRRRRRMGDIDWFDAAYRVYLVGGFGGGGVLWISSSVKDTAVSAGAAADVLRNGPTLLGMVAALALLVGLRTGAQGGPLALEAADVVHVMLAPIDRRAALSRPSAQRLRSALFSGAVAGAVVGQLAARRLPGSIVAWAAGGASFGASVALLWMAAALLAHTLRLPRAIATTVGLALVVWQAAAVVWHIPGVGNVPGSLGLWGWRQHPVDLVVPALGIAGCVVGFTLLGRISLDALSRRSALVAQLKFAVTMQDLRTVILLRRQLNQEQARQRPILRVAPDRARRHRAGRHTVGLATWRRGWHGLLRFPTPRLVRMAALSAGIGVLQAAVIRGTTPAFVGTALLGFMLGLEVMEPLSQEVDQADRADALPIERGQLMAWHLAAPATALVPFAIVAGVAAWATLGFSRTAALPIAVLCVPTLLGAAAGGVVSIVRDAPNPFSTATQQAFVPPEMAGFTTTLRLIWPIVVSTATTCTVLLVRTAQRHGDSLTGAALRGALGATLFVALVAWWVRARDRLRLKIRSFLDEGRAYTANQRNNGGTSAA
jgi:hypothetical protein